MPDCMLFSLEQWCQCHSITKSFSLSLSVKNTQILRAEHLISPCCVKCKPLDHLAIAGRLNHMIQHEKKYCHLFLKVENYVYGNKIFQCCIATNSKASLVLIKCFYKYSVYSIMPVKLAIMGF